MEKPSFTGFQLGSQRAYLVDGGDEVADGRTLRFGAVQPDDLVAADVLRRPAFGRTHRLTLAEHTLPYTSNSVVRKSIDPQRPLSNPLNVSVFLPMNRPLGVSIGRCQ